MNIKLYDIHQAYNKHEISSSFQVTGARPNDTTIYLCNCGGMVGLRFNGWPTGTISKDALRPNYTGQDIDGFRAWYIHKVFTEMAKVGKGNLLLGWLASNKQLDKYWSEDGTYLVSDNDKNEDIYKGVPVRVAR